MTVEAIPGEVGRFWVSSRSRPEMLHVVDLQWQEEPRQKPHAFCGCEDSMAKGHICGHIIAVVEAEKLRLHL